MNSTTINEEPLAAQEESNVSPPESVAGERREVFVGRGVSIYYDSHAPARWPEHSHSQLELMLLSEEAMCDFRWRRVNGDWCEENIRGLQLCVVAPEVVHAGEWLRSADLISLHIEPGVWPTSLQAADRDVSVRDFEDVAGHDPVICQLALSLRLLCRQPAQSNGPGVESIGTVLAMHLIKALARAREGSVDPGLSLSRCQLDRVIHHINEHLGERLPIAALARVACLSSCYFIRLFNRSMGLPPHRYVLNCRLKKAKELLSTGKFRVAEVAYETGFCDQSHLNRHFRKFFGFTPRALLKRGRDSQ